ncbi:MAG: PQQ-binding-like beta-propeller repeat protein [Bacteroidales bacterium]|nr:PQQ-binding-like beta-propeller repeat protein [Bacteroidales bacterium]HDS07517.1 alcohol dehydrogenase [Bacteroides sp.]
MRKMIWLIAAGIIYSLSGEAQEPTRWRGPQGNGIYFESGLLQRWPSEGPEIFWVFEGLGKGHSSAVVRDGYVFTTGMVDSSGYLFKIKLSGELVNKFPYGPEFAESYYGTRSTPVILGDTAYICSAYGDLVCMDHNTGKKIWNVDMPKDLGGKVITWGYNETVVIDGDVVYCTPGGPRNNIVALNRHNGEVIWTSRGMGELSAYCSPLLFVHNGRKLLATHTASHFLCLDAGSGELLWSYSHPNQYSVHANTPIYWNGELLFFSGYGQGAVRIQLDAEGKSASVDWKSEVFDSRIGGAVLVNGYLYGSGDFSRSWKCLDWNNGEIKYESSELAKGTVIYADGMLYCYSERGELALAGANPEKFEIKGMTKVTKGSEQHWSHPVIHDGILYVRHGNALIAYKVR